MSNDTEFITSLDVGELEALADGKLALASQSRLNELLSRNSESQLSTDETSELDQLLEQVDKLTILKTRARYTLQQQTEAFGS